MGLEISGGAMLRAPLVLINFFFDSILTGKLLSWGSLCWNTGPCLWPLPTGGKPSSWLALPSPDKKLISKSCGVFKNDAVQQDGYHQAPLRAGDVATPCQSVNWRRQKTSAIPLVCFGQNLHPCQSVHHQLLQFCILDSFPLSEYLLLWRTHLDDQRPLKRGKTFSNIDVDYCSLSERGKAIPPQCGLCLHLAAISHDLIKSMKLSSNQKIKTIRVVLADAHCSCSVSSAIWHLLLSLAKNTLWHVISH